MKKLISGVIICMFILTACGKQEEESRLVPITESNLAAQYDVNGNEEPYADLETPAVDLSKVDIDMTDYDYNLAIGVFNDMYNNLESYQGRVVKFSGTATAMYDPTGDITYYSCYILDGTQCCQAGIEYVTADGNYPNNGDEIIITGVLESYTASDGVYMHLVDAKLEYK